MASESEAAELSDFFERLLRQRDFSLFVPFLVGFTTTRTTTTNQNQNQSSGGPPNEDGQDPNQETRQETQTTQQEEQQQRQHERVILINPFTQGMVVIEGATSLETLFRDLVTKNGPPPASKASIDALPCVDVGGGSEGGECVICLEELSTESGGGVEVKEMPCKHMFHGGCIEKWLGLHGSCPVCRYKMPVDDDLCGKKRGDGEVGSEGERRREIWVGFSFNGRRSGDGYYSQNTNFE